MTTNRIIEAGVVISALIASSAVYIERMSDGDYAVEIYVGKFYGRVYF